MYHTNATNKNGGRRMKKLTRRTDCRTYKGRSEIRMCHHLYQSWLYGSV